MTEVLNTKKSKGDFNMAKEKECIERHDRFDEEVNMTIVFPWEREREELDGTPINHNEGEDEISDLYGLDKDDCLARTYPGVSDKD